MEYKLSNSGLLTDSNKYVILLDLIKKYKKDSLSGRSISYNKKNATIIIEMDYGEETYNIQLNEEQKYKYENGVSDPNLDEIRALINFDNDAKYKSQVINDFAKGKELTEPRAINIYSKHLNNDLLRAGAAICLGSILTLSPLIIFGISVPVIMSNINNPTIWKTILAGILDFIAVVEGIIFVKGEILTEMISEMQYVFKETRLVLAKKKDFMLYEKQLKETSLANVYNNQTYQDSVSFLNDIKKTLEKISELPEEEQTKYSLQVKEIIEEYQSKSKELISSGEENRIKELINELNIKLSSIKNDMEHKEEFSFFESKSAY